MAKLSRQRWKGTTHDALPRRDRRPCAYDAYLPDRLVGRSIALDGPVAADVAEAELAISRLNMQARALSDSEALARVLLRSESVASSKIEGVEIGTRRLLRVEAARELGARPRDVRAAYVLGNIDAMFHALRSLAEGEPITFDLLLEAHRRLLAESPLAEQGGCIRTRQNWIGGSSFNPCSAVYVPPPWQLVEGYLADLVEFCNDDSLPAVAQAALAHAQFETIHPFIDGNGRTGRVLIHMVLRRRGLAPRLLPPVSLVLATSPGEYIAALQGTRYVAGVDSAEAHQGLNRWIGLLAAACRRAVADATMLEERVARIQEHWRTRLGRVRSNSALDLLLRALPGAPILTVQGAAALIGRSVPAANGAIARMVEADVLAQSTVGKRNRAFEAYELIRAFTDLERQLASPNGDTRVTVPTRPLPRRNASETKGTTRPERP